MTQPVWPDEYIGLPYANIGRSRESGVDCWGLTLLVYKEQLGIDLPLHEADYRFSHNAHQVSGLIIADSHRSWHKVGTPQEFDVVVFVLSRKPSHIGLMLDSSLFMHNLLCRNVTVGSVDSFMWKRRIHGFFRFNDRA